MANKNRTVGPKKGPENRDLHEGREEPRLKKDLPGRSQFSLFFRPKPKQSPESQDNQLPAGVASLPVILFAVDREGTFTVCEGKGWEALRLSPGELVGRSLFELYPDSPETHKMFEEALDGKTSRSRDRLGDKVFETSFCPLSDHSGKAAGVIGLGVEIAGNVDVTGAMKPEELSGVSVREVEEAGRKADTEDSAKSQFLARVSHELRAPLNSIVGFANLVSQNKEARLGEQDLFYLNRILGNATHLLTVVAHMLDNSAINSDKLALTISEERIDTLVSETIADLGGHARSDSLEIVAEIPKDVRPVETDRLKLKQVLINLLANALKFTERGRITVRVGVDKECRPIRIDVVDTGVGIPQDKLESIFEAFERVPVAPGQTVEGVGLGLTISRSLCEMMGYRIGVESKLGAGSTFTIYFSSDSQSG